MGRRIDISKHRERKIKIGGIIRKKGKCVDGNTVVGNFEAFSGNGKRISKWNTHRLTVSAVSHFSNAPAPLRFCRRLHHRSSSGDDDPPPDCERA